MVYILVSLDQVADRKRFTPNSKRQVNNLLFMFSYKKRNL
jgi:hypothetical protein